MSDKVAGSLLLTATGVFFTYYTLWVIVLPFVDEDQVYIHSWFPDSHLAVCLPFLAGAIGLAGIGTFVSMVMLGGSETEKTH